MAAIRSAASVASLGRMASSRRARSRSGWRVMKAVAGACESTMRKAWRQYGRR